MFFLIYLLEVLFVLCIFEWFFKTKISLFHIYTKGSNKKLSRFFKAIKKDE